MADAMKNSAYRWNIAAGKTLVSIGSPAHNVSSGDFEVEDGKNYIWKQCEDTNYAALTYATDYNYDTGKYY
ncbi:hypothetical protein [Acutalibacter sp. 1XD8-33]|uniref:hypothetical protein n=1 Tax=Acutalibacter sp. 1XD8-33 TaxID=2320081 RepID=UPI0011C47F28|nr:hypothetical protein [Acutalibacter sp. 1XD8-33]